MADLFHFGDTSPMPRDECPPLGDTTVCFMQLFSDL